MTSATRISSSKLLGYWKLSTTRKQGPQYLCDIAVCLTRLTVMLSYGVLRKIAKPSATAKFNLVNIPVHQISYMDCLYRGKHFLPILIK